MVEEDPPTRLTPRLRLLPEEEEEDEEEEEHPHLPAYYTHDDGTWNHPAHPRRESVISLTTGSAHSIDVPIEMKKLKKTSKHCSWPSFEGG